MGEGWNNLKGPLSTGALTGLEFCANELGKIHSETKIPEEELTSLKEQFSKLIREVSAASIPTEIKLILLDLLTTALISIEQYSIVGNEGLKKSIAYAIGTLTLHQDQFLRSKGENLVKQVKASLLKMVSLIKVAYSIKELADTVPDHLLLLH